METAYMDTTGIDTEVVPPLELDTKQVPVPYPTEESNRTFTRIRQQPDRLIYS
jgi:hypothetical protein